MPGYEMHRPLGVGGMGHVYEATDTATGEAAAVKILAARWSADPEAVARFNAEASALRQLDHDGIVRIHATGTTDDGRLFIAMELVPGCDLGRLLRTEKLDRARAFDICLKVCGALSHAHRRGIVHRDLKPSNILMGRDGTVKLADFGLAKHLTDEHSHYGVGDLTQTRDTFGTPYYIAPEALRGSAAITPAADVYAAGVLLYHLLTGSPPLGNYTPLSEAAGLPQRADALLSAALQADPAKRTADTGEFARGVESVRDAMQRGASQRRVWRRAAAGTVAGVLLSGAAGVGAWFSRKPDSSPPAPVFDDPHLAGTAAPWTNSLGMKFVPVGSGNLLFSVWETRRRDYEPFFAADRGMLPEWRAEMVSSGRHRTERVQTLTASGWQESGGSWRDPGFTQTPDDPVVGVALFDARLFCLWLTWKERAEGRLTAPDRYRVPTDEEWSMAAGLPAERGATPRLRNAALPDKLEFLPGNHAGPEARAGSWPASWPVTAAADAFPRTAPAGSFPPLPNGLHDLGGNAAEWVDSLFAPHAVSAGPAQIYTIRGASWATGAAAELRPDARRSGRLRQGIADAGFRCVLDLTEPPEPEDETFR